MAQRKVLQMPADQLWEEWRNDLKRIKQDIEIGQLLRRVHNREVGPPAPDDPPRWTPRFSRGPAPAAQGAPVNLTGTWKGTGRDRFVQNNAEDGMKVTWVLTQTGSTVSGTVVTDSLVSGDGSCSSCHRAKTGTISGTVSGTSLMLTMDFPGQNGEVTSDCTATFSGTASGISGNAFTTLYSGGDSCENPPGETIAYADGTLDVVRVFTDDPLTAGSSVIRAMHTTELRVRIDALRVRFGLEVYLYTDPPPSAGTGILAHHIANLRTALSEVYLKAGSTPPTYTDEPLTAGTVMKAVHIGEIRAALIAIE